MGEIFMNSYQLISLFLLLIVSFTIQAADNKPSVIYGKDERLEVSNTNDFFITERAKFVAAMIHKGKIKSLDHGQQNFQIESRTLLDRKEMCPDERFVNQIAPANCTSFLVAPDVLLTAGHCVLSQRDCESYRFIFNFVEKNGRESPEHYNVRSDEVFYCKKLLARKLIPREKIDYAIIQLDRPHPSKLDFFKDVIKKPSSFHFQLEQFLVMGHPLGIPLKASDYVDFKKVREKDPKRIFRIKSDTFVGNSGSPVFSRHTGYVTGMLIGGERDLNLDEANNCNRVRVCQESDDCTGEAVLKIDEIPIDAALRERVDKV